MKGMPVVYIAGPFRGDCAWDIECNVRRAEEASLDVWCSGAAALCPHTNTRFFHGAASDNVWIDGTLELMRRCDAVYLVRGWQGSSGTLDEIKEALRLGIPVLLSMREVAKYVEMFNHMMWSRNETT